MRINGKLADKDGRLFEGMTVDGLHLSVEGYQVWADALKPIFTELLGPPRLTTPHVPPAIRVRKNETPMTAFFAALYPQCYAAFP